MRNYLHRFFSIGLIMLILLAACQSQKQQEESTEETQPNILIILADDMGYSDVGCYGSEIPTPNIDRLAEEGLRFTQFYNTARCSPSRASLLTGLYPHQAGVGYLTSEWAQYIRDSLGAPGYQDQLSKNSVTIAEVLKPAGYQTYMSGKWHIGQKPPYWPVKRGFDASTVMLEGYNYFRPQDGLWAHNGDTLKPDTTDFYATNFITDQAISSISRHDSEKPFFMYLAYTAPHWPIQAPPEAIARHKGKYMIGWDSLRAQRYERLKALGMIDESWPISERNEDAPAWATLSEEEKNVWDTRMATYAAQVEILDQGIGKVMDELERKGLKDNTLVIFLSDNGASAEPIDRGEPDAEIGTAESFLAYGLPWANASNTPFRLYKHHVHEGGIATPFIVHWPAGISAKENNLVHQQGHLIDVMATCLEVSGAKYPKEFKGNEIIPLEGKSLLPYFRGDTIVNHPELYWEHEGNRAVRQGPWKIVSRYRQPWELYNMEENRTETNNLSLGQREKVEAMKQMYQRWADRAFVVPWEKTGKK